MQKKIDKWKKPLRSSGNEAARHHGNVTGAKSGGIKFGRMKPDKFRHEISGGGIVFRKRGKIIEIAMMLDPFGKWTFSKGHVEAGEEIVEAAARETLEEMGLEEIRMIDELGKVEIWFRDRYVHKGALIRKEIHFFLFETKPDAVLHPAGEHAEAAEARWVPVSRVLSMTDYPDMIPIVKKAFSILNSSMQK